MKIEKILKMIYMLEIEVGALIMVCGALLMENLTAVAVGFIMIVDACLLYVFSEDISDAYNELKKANDELGNTLIRRLFNKE